MSVRRKKLDLGFVLTQTRNFTGKNKISVTCLHHPTDLSPPLGLAHI